MYASIFGYLKLPQYSQSALNKNKKDNVCICKPLFYYVAVVFEVVAFFLLIATRKIVVLSAYIVCK